MLGPLAITWSGIVLGSGLLLCWILGIDQGVGGRKEREGKGRMVTTK